MKDEPFRPSNLQLLNVYIENGSFTIIHILLSYTLGKYPPVSPILLFGLFKKETVDAKKNTIVQ